MVAEQTVRKIWEAEIPIQEKSTRDFLLLLRVCVFLCVWATFVYVCLLGWLTLGFFLDRLTLYTESGSHPEPRVFRFSSCQQFALGYLVSASGIGDYRLPPCLQAFYVGARSPNSGRQHYKASTFSHRAISSDPQSPDLMSFKAVQFGESKDRSI